MMVQTGCLLSVTRTIFFVAACANVQADNARNALLAKDQDYMSNAPASDPHDPPVVSRVPSSGRFVRQLTKKLNLGLWWELDSPGKVRPSFERLLPSHNISKLRERYETGSSEHIINGSKLEWECNNTDVSLSCQFRQRCGQAPMNPITSGHERILNGQNQTPGEWPSYVQLIIKHGTKVKTEYCGGTLVSDRHVLTAAYCLWLWDEVKQQFSWARPQWLRAFMGRHDSIHSPMVQVRVGKKICLAAKYSPFPMIKPSWAFHDWALIELAKPVEFTDHVQPACLPFKPIKKQGEGSVCYAVGRGLIRQDKNNPAASTAPSVTQKLRVSTVECPILGLEAYFNSSPELKLLKECYASTGKQPGGGCYGDSGDPVLCLNNEKHWTVASVSSSSKDGCYDVSDKPRVDRYTPIGAHMGDIKTQCNF